MHFSSRAFRRLTGFVSFAFALFAAIAVQAEATKLATFVGFDTRTNGAYTATIGTGNTLNADGSVTIGSNAIDITSTTTNWNCTVAGISVLVKYSSLPLNLSAGSAVVTVRHTGASTSTGSGVGVYADSNGIWQGIWQGKAWDSSKGSTAADTSGYIVFTTTGTDNSGTSVYNGSGSSVYADTGLRSTTKGTTLGDRINVGGTAENAMVSTNLVVEGCVIYEGVLSSSEIINAVSDYEAAAAEKAEAKRDAAVVFDWTPGTAPTGWFTGWGGENSGAAQSVIGSDGTVTNLQITGTWDDKAWTPWKSGVAAQTNYTFTTYGCADMVQAEEGQLAVLWCMGGKSEQKTALVKGSDGHIQLVQVAGTSTTSAYTIDAGAVKGYHLFTVRFNQNTGASLQIDDGTVYSDEDFRTVSGGGLQVGSVLSGVDGLTLAREPGFVVCHMSIYDKSAMPAAQYAALVAQYPAVTTMSALSYSTSGGTVYLPSLTLSSGELRIQQGTLEVPAGVEASLSALEFGDLKGSPSFGMNLGGMITINTSSSGSDNSYGTAYSDCNKGYGVIFSEWTGTGTYNIMGTFNAPNTYVELCHDANTSTLNVTGGTFIAKGITSKWDGRATINLTDNGTLNLGAYPSATASIAKNYGAGTVIVTANAIDTDDISFTDAETGTTFELNGVTLTLSGTLSGESNKVNVVATNNGALVYKGRTFTSGTYTVAELVHFYVVSVDGVKYEDYTAAINRAMADDATITLLANGNADDLLAAATILSVTLTYDSEAGTYAVGYNLAAESVLRVTEIMPKPTDGEYDVNGLTSGWVELTNTSTTAWANLADYKFIRVNRKKKTDTSVANFPSVKIAPGKTYTFLTSERYDNSADATVSAFQHGSFDGNPVLYGPELNNVLVWGDKVNPKKSCFVRLYYAPSGTIGSIVDTVVIPVDLPESYSIVIDPVETGKATSRWMQPRAKGGAISGTKVALGPNVGPLYELTSLKKHDSANEFAAPQPPAAPDEDYTVTFALNPVMSPTSAGKFRSEDAITNIVMIYRSDLTNAERRIVVDLSTKTTDKNDWGDKYTVTIDKDYLPERGHLMQWKYEIVDASGNTWTSPAFLNADDGYQWYGTIVEPTADLMAEHLATWHMFADVASVSQMDTDADKQSLANGARVGIYDSSTSNYYDYVRIDLRGNTSAGFTKKSHGLRFCKPHPLTMYDPVRGTTWEEIRKTSLIGEPADPSRLRQLTSFWLWDKMDNKVPFDFPVRCNLNGKFFQVGFNSERFTDELVEDVYGFDKYGYSYKNVGTLASGSGTSAGGIEKKTPDDGVESDVSVLQSELRKVISDAGAGSVNDDNANLTKIVVERFNLPAWLNYLASARITHEMDDVWANISMYYDNPTMKDGSRGTGTWMPLGYDFNLSLGAYYREGGLVNIRPTLMSNQDWFKSHPFYGGMTAVCYLQTNYTSQCNGGNYGLESVLQSSKFRRLFLRRLRTLMDQYLGAPNADETFETTTSPIIEKMKEVAALMGADGDLDRAEWPWDNSISANDAWGSKDLFPSNVMAGVENVYTGYIVPRREHLYVTHSVTNTAFEIGYGQKLNAGIPLAQSAVKDLREKITASYDVTLGAVVISNANEEVVDLSGWSLTGPVTMTLPAGTVIDLMTNGVPGTVYVTADRRTTIAAMTLTDQVVVGNGTAGKTDAKIALTAADGTKVIFDPSPAQNYLRLAAFDGVTCDGGDGDEGEWVMLTNISDSVSLDLTGVRFTFEKQTESVSCDVTLPALTLAPNAAITFDRATYWPSGRIKSNKLYIYIYDADGEIVQYAAVEQKKFANYYAHTAVYHLAVTSTSATLGQGDFIEVCDVPPAPEYTVGDVVYTNLEEAISNVTGATTFVLPSTCTVAVVDAAAGKITIDGVEYTLPLAPLTDGSSYSVTLDGTTLTVAVLTPGSLRISEICPKDSSYLISNKYETGWVELVNDGEQATDLSGYELVRFNRGKAMKSSGNNLPAKTIAAGERVVIYCNEYFPNAEDNGGDGKTAVAYDDLIVYPNKISQKKYPMVCLYKSGALIDKVIVPVDCPDGSSIVCGGIATKSEDAGDDEPSSAAALVPWSVANLTLDTGIATNTPSVTDKSNVTLTTNLWDFTGNSSCNLGVHLDATVAAQLVATNSYTVDLWFMIPSNTGSGNTQSKGMPIFESRPSKDSPYNGIIIYVDPEGELVVQPRNAGKTVFATDVMDSDTRYDDGNWHHLVFEGSQLSTGKMRVVVDGTQLWYSQMGGLAPLRADWPLYFGRAGDSTSWFTFKGYIADVKLYSGSTITDTSTVTNPTESAEAALVLGNATRRFQTTHATKGAENNLTDAVAVGPQISSLYGVKDAADPWKAFPQATPATAYTVTLPVNPVDSANDDDAIVSVTLLYLADFGDIIGTVPMTRGSATTTDGQFWTADIPADAIPAAGHLVRWAAKITDAAGNVWRAPSFNDPDGSYEWYGTIVTPTADQVSEKLQTFHLFGDSKTADSAGNGSTGYLMNRQADAISGTYPYGARIGVYDSTTGLYYDNVKIDLRGNSTASLKKKSHGVRFNKSQPLSCVDPVTKTVVDEVRKTSWIAEYPDPTYIRQSLSFKAFRDMGNKVPFAYPVRLNINGAFYELADHSNRFTDELIEDYYGMDPYGYTYKSVGQLNTSLSTTGGGIEKKTPDDGNEQDYTQLKTFVNSFADSVKGDGSEVSNVTKTVVEKFNLPAWINYLAMARVSQECDDVWANLCVYYDVNDTDTWMPLAYDLNLSWGAIYNGDIGGHPGAKSNDDTFKSHPLYGGLTIQTGSKGNCGFEAVYQSPKFRRLFLRRLRTAMDKVLQAPGTAKADSPYWQYCENLASNILAEATTDRAKWGYPTGAGMYTWSSALTPNEGMDDLWENYFVPRREHFYVTHSVTNSEKTIGYGTDYNAGIPAAQSPIASLKDGFGAVAIEGGVMITNLNAETVDMSGWAVSGPVTMTLPAGTVIDLCTNGVAGALYVVTDRKAYVAAHAATLTDEVIVGNAAVGSGASIGLKTAEGETVIAADVVLDPGAVSGVYDVPVSFSGSGTYTLNGAAFNKGLTIPEGVYTIKNQNPYTNTASVVSAVGASIAFTGKGTFSLAGEKESGTLMEVGDLYVSNGVFAVESKATTTNTNAVVVHGSLVVEDKGTVNLKLTKNAAGGRGFYLDTKDKLCRIGKGGTFVAELNGAGCRAIQCSKGSVDLEIEEGATVTCTGKAVNARYFKMDGNIKICGGTVDLAVESTGTGTELLSCEKSVKISGGTIALNSTDDCVSATKDIEVSGGTIVGVSSANDVFDANGNITITGGTLALISAAAGHEGLDCDPDGTSAGHKLTITGGTVYATGGENAYWHTPEAGGQDWVTITGDYDSESWVMVTVPDGLRSTSSTPSVGNAAVAPSVGNAAVAPSVGNAAVTNVVTGFKVPAGAKTFFVSMAGATRETVVCGGKSASATSEAVVLVPWIYTWNEVTETTVEVVPGGATELSATDAESAAVEAGKVVIALSDEDTAAGLTTNSLIVVAEAVTNGEGSVTGYRAVVAVNPATVNSPAIGGGTIVETSEAVEPLAVEETTEEGTAVSIGVNNAVKGLWYGYEVSDAVASGYANDTGSFTRAKETTVKIKGSPRKAATGFFRVKVLPAKPTK